MRDAARSGGKTDELEVTQKFIILDEFSFTLEDFDFDGGLAIGSSGENLGFLGGYGGVAADEASEDAAEGFDTQGEGSNIEEEDIGNVAGQDGSLNGGTDGNGFIGIDRFGRIPLEESLDGFNDPRGVRKCYIGIAYLGIRVIPPTRMTSLI